MSFLKKLEISVSVALAFTLLFSVVGFAKTSAQIRDEVLRLHVIANSDTSTDQNLKLAVRDAVLEAGAEIFDGSVNVDNAVEKITPEIDYLEAVALNVINERGFDYGVKITIDREFFTTRTYDTVTLPAGEYLAVRVIIGAGEGHNWWCVMFPPMCLSAAKGEKELSDVLSSDGEALVKSNPKYEPRFKIIEVYEQIKRYVAR